ncbi:MAG: isoprenylcysteine carboxylmethyltransferase family protein [Acidobacteriota bacterium]
MRHRIPDPLSLELAPGPIKGVPVEEILFGWTLMVAGTALGAWATAERTPASVAIGATLLIPGVLLALAAVRTLGKPQGLVTWGPYRWVRHPYFLAVLLLLLGAIVALRAWPALILFLPAVRLTIARARREEHNLSLRFGEEHQAYCRQVSFLLPLGPPLPQDRARGSGLRAPSSNADERNPEAQDRGPSGPSRTPE